MKRIMFFVHYNKQNLLSDYIFYMINTLKPIFNKIIFISNSILPENKLINLKEIVDIIIQRKNVGYDFGAIKDGLNSFGWDKICQYDSLTLMNDTCFGPLFPVEEIYKKMESNHKIDFWGLTIHPKSKKGHPVTNTAVNEHIQSYFMVFNKNVIESNIFKKFWENITFYKDAENVIVRYEMKLTKILSDNGFKYDYYFKIKDYLKKNSSDPTFQFPDLLLKEGFPFVKIKSFLRHKHPRYIVDLIGKYSNYPINLIFNHFNSVFSPNISATILNKNFFGCNKKHIKKKEIFIAIHFHVYYTDICNDFFLLIKPYTDYIDLFITTDTEEKKQKILEFYNNLKLKNLKGIYVLNNKGRDILPWLKIASEFRNYEIIGHFHTKKSPSVIPWVGASWQNEIWRSLIIPLPEIIKLFIEDNDIGIIIPDIPYYFKIALFDSGWSKNTKICSYLWEKMKCSKKIDFDKIKTPIMPYGSMCWYRPDALKPLFDLKLTENDFPDEPLPKNKTLAHAIERLLVYIAWNQGYDFRISLQDIISGFDYEIRENAYTLEELLFYFKNFIKYISTYLKRKFIKVIKIIRILISLK